MAALQQRASGGIWPLVVALLVALGLAVIATTPPAPVPATAPAGAFSAGRAMADVRVIARAPHVSGSPEDAAVVRWLVGRLGAMGMIARAEPFSPDFAALKAGWSPPWPVSHTMTNVVAVLPGRDRTLPAVALMAHHDSVPGSPAAADDGTGVAAILETVRAIAAGPRPLRDIVVILTDGEEPGLHGARHFFQGVPQADPMRDHIGALINLEARGGGGRAKLFETGPANGAAVRLAAGAIAQPSASSLAVYLYRKMPNDTDLTTALPWAAERGVAAYNFAFVGRPGLYHSPRATAAALDQGALQHIGGQVLDLTRALATAPALPVPAPDVVFFDLFGLTIITLPLWAGWVFLAGAFCAILVISRRPGKAPVRAAVGGAVRIFALMLVAGVLAVLANRLSVHPGGSNYYDRLAANPRLEAMALLAGLAAFFAVMARWKPDAAGIIGALLPLWLLAAVAQGMAPMAAYVLVLPVTLAALAALCAPSLPWLAAACAAPVVGYQLALGHELFEAVGNDLPVLITVPLAVATLAILPLWQPLTARARLVALAVVLVGGLALALVIRNAPLADTVPAYSLKE